MTDQMSGHEIAGREIAGHNINLKVQNIEYEG